MRDCLLASLFVGQPCGWFGLLVSPVLPHVWHPMLPMAPTSMIGKGGVEKHLLWIFFLMLFFPHLSIQQLD